MEENLTHILRRFDIKGALTELNPIKRGHINDTYDCSFEADGVSRRFVLQRINHIVFKNVPALMENVARVTRHLEMKLAGNPEERTLRLIPSREGQAFVPDDQGNFWRVYNYITGCKTHDVCQSQDLAFAAGQGCGRFQMLLSDLSPLDFYETIPFFHHTPHRFEALEAAASDAARGRVEAARPELEFALGLRETAGAIVEAMKRGAVPIRVVHNDLKLNNILFGGNPPRAVCVLDLDTCMAGASLYDFGDLVRNVSVSAAEDERNLDLIKVNLSYFERIAAGFLGAAGAVLTAGELELMPVAPQIIALELGVRFLTDYFSGDVYFKTQYPDQNLARARSQLRSVRNFIAAEESMRAVIEQISSDKMPRL